MAATRRRLTEEEKRRITLKVGDRVIDDTTGVEAQIIALGPHQARVQGDAGGQWTAPRERLSRIEQQGRS
ncbi:hypothetical protein BIV57_10875 [Mangrovactinospora gilvigrisea]|uniref:DUF1918 domain-containing protein n=1 Tax=Mangrovactinospora gilvigrisea TaxID=1428644 RepID=A0A1J7C7D7_9ACTN|nr:hypothetical protein [Mangrovactinospora gilvigrisea]OIV37464.1 hypothetical protein BIV57_10875 [Mangrovactinospora gilvigrisea]